MPAPTPEPDRPPPADPAAGAESRNPSDAPAGHGSTGSHRPAPPDRQLSSLLPATAGRRPPSAADVAAHLAAAEPDPDDAPTVITTPAKSSAVTPAPPPPPPYVVGEAPALAGRRLGHFELIEAIGAGGMAAVLKARDAELGRTVALKILPPDSAADAENVTRFKQEARAAAKLDHDNVARVYFCGEDQGLHFIAFEFVEGVTLRALIERRGPLPAGECVRYMLQIAAGLGHAADRGVVHRDIKPSNVIVTPDGRAKIVDMGLARHLDPGSVSGVTESGVTLGTFDYISPEQALDPRRADVRSDIYSLGCTFYHALTGRPPVPDGTAAKKLHAHQHVAPLDPRELNPAVPDEMAAVLSRMMAKDAGRRFRTPADLIAHLKAVGQRLHVPVDAAVTDSAARAVAPVAQVLPTPPRVRPGWVVAAAAVLAAAVVIARSGAGPAVSPAPPPWAAVTKGDDPLPVPAGPPPVVPVVADGVARPGTADELAKALADPAVTRIELSPGGVYDLAVLNRPVTVTAAELRLATPAGPAARVRLAPTTPTRPGSLAVRAKAVTLGNVWFTFAPADEAGAVGLDVRDAGQVELADCLFTADDRARAAGLTAVAVTAPQVQLDRCLFGPGGVGLRVPAGATVRVTDCGFGPHAAGVAVKGDGADGGPTDVRLDRSSFVVDTLSAVVEADPAAAVKVTAGGCVFAPGGADLGLAGSFFPGRRGAAVRVTGERAANVKLDLPPNRPNAAYRVDAVAAGWKAVAVPLDPAGWRELRQRPWDAPDGGPLAALATADPWRAFRLRLTDPDLFGPKGSDLRVVGAQFAAGGPSAGRVYADTPWPPPLPAVAAAKVWRPKPAADAPLAPGESDDLVKLLRDARPGDTILIRHNGPLAMEPVTLPARGGPAAADFHITFKPDRGYTPVLTPDASREVDVALFKVREGRATFDGLQFLIRPPPPGGYDSVAAVAVAGGRGCTFKSCVFTLDEEDGRAAAAVTLPEPGREMKMDAGGTRPTPRVTFDGCLIRGKGRGVWVPSSRPFQLDLEGCVTALNGPVVGVKAAARDPGGATPATVRLARVTAVLGGPVVELNGGRVGEMRASGLVPTHVTADGCLFAAVPAAGRPLVEVAGAELDRADGGVLRWDRGADPNRFANFDPAAPPVVVRPGDAPAREWSWNDWFAFAGEVVKPAGTARFDRPPAGLKELMTLTAADVRVRAVEFRDVPDAKPADAGADPDKVARPVAPVPDDDEPDPE